MGLSYWSRNTLTNLGLLLLITSYLVCIGNTYQRYPYVLPKCCQSPGNSIADGNSGASVNRSIASCENEDSVVVMLPKQLFPVISTDSDHVEVDLRNVEGGLKCEGTQPRYTEIDLSQFQALRHVSVGKKEVFDGIAFSNDNLLAVDGHIYSPAQFCISSRDTNKTHLAIKTCKQTCSSHRPCIQRCCGGHQSILTSPPTPSTESILGLCSSPSLRNESWNPWTSNIRLEAFHESHFYQTRYSPRIKRVNGKSVPQEDCLLLRVTETPLLMWSDGRLVLMVNEGYGQRRTVVTDNFCLDGIKGEAGGNFHPTSADNCEAFEEKEVIVIYVCSWQTILSGPTTSWNINHKESISLPACSCLANLLYHPIQIPFNFQRTTSGVVPLVRLTPGHNGGNLECPQGYEDVTEEYGNLTGQLFFMDGSLYYRKYLFSQSQFCIRSVFRDAVTVRTCKGMRGTPFVGTKEPSWWSIGLLELTLYFFMFLSQIFYVAIIVVFILRKDKDLVLRWSIIGYSISAIFHTCAFLVHVGMLGQVADHLTRFIFGLALFCVLHGFAWMSILSFDIWFHFTFLRPGKKSTKRLWGYVVFAFTLPVVYIAWIYSQRFIDPSRIVLAYLPHVVRWCLFTVNFLLYIATAVKLWIAQNSSDIKNQRNTFLMYFKLFLLMGLRWVNELLIAYIPLLEESYHIIFNVVIQIFLLLHPVILFCFLTWETETKAYLESKYPRVQRAMDFLGGIGYPVRKCWGLCKSCNLNQEAGANGIEGVEAPHNSNHMYVHTRRTPNIPKERNIFAPANTNDE